MTRITLLYIFITLLPLKADIIGLNGVIRFDSDSDQQSEITLNSTGLGIGTLPSANLHVAGNALITEQLTIGSSTLGAANLQLSGTLGFSFVTLNTDTTLTENNAHSLILLDTSSDNVEVDLPYAGNVTGRQISFKKTSTMNHSTILGGGNLIDQFMALNFGSELSSAKVLAGSTQWYLIHYQASGDNNIIFEDDFFIDGVIRMESNTIDGTRVGSFTDALNFTPYTFSVNNTGGLVARYNLPGGLSTGDAGLYYSNSAGADSVVNVNFSDFSSYASFELSADMRALETMGMSMGFGVDNGVFSNESGDALYIKSDGGTGSANVSLIVRHAGTDYVLETFDDHDTLNASTDSMTLFYHRINNTISGSFTDIGNGTLTFSTYSLDAVGGGFTPQLSLVQFEIVDELGSNSNFPNWNKISLKGSSNP